MVERSRAVGGVSSQGEGRVDPVAAIGSDFTEMTEHRYPLQILERHLDTFGHVNNATYLELFEEARWDWITKNGYGVDRVQRDRKGPTILEVNLVFKRELRNRQHVEVVSWVESYPSRVGTAIQRIVDAEGTLYCDARFVMGLFDLEERKLILPTPEWKRALGMEAEPPAPSLP